MKIALKSAILLFIASVCLPAIGQTAAFTRWCEQGSVSSLTSGLQSSNKLQGIIPQCTVNVFLTGTTNLATIYADANNTPLSNPFTATTAGQWLFYAAIGQGYDVVMSGGIPPLTYSTPVTLTDLINGGGSTGSGCATSGSAGILLGTNGSGGCENLDASFASNTFTFGVSGARGFTINGATVNLNSTSPSTLLGNSSPICTVANALCTGTVVTWPAAADIVISNGTNSPAGLAPGTIGNCPLSTGTAWASVPCVGGITQLLGPVTAGPGSGSQTTTITPTGVAAGSYGPCANLSFLLSGQASSATTVTCPVNLGLDYVQQGTGTYYQLIYPTSCTPTHTTNWTAVCTSDNKGGSMTSFATGSSSLVYSFSGATAPVGATITGIYAFGFSSATGNSGSGEGFGVTASGGGTNCSLLPVARTNWAWAYQQTGCNVSTGATLADIVITMDMIISLSNVSATAFANNVGIEVDYNVGPVPPVVSGVLVVPPLNYNAEAQTLSIGQNWPTAIYPTIVSQLVNYEYQWAGEVVPVTDGASATDCSTGGGSNLVNCVSNGNSGWTGYPYVAVTSLTATSPLSVTASTGAITISCATCPTSATGTTFSVNGGSTLGSANYNATTPSADSSFLALTPKISGSNFITEAPYATNSTFGVVEPDDVTIAATAGVLALIHNATTVNGQTCTLGSTCTIPNGSATVFGTVKVDNTTITASGGVISAVNSVTYPGAGIANSTGSAWGTSYTVGNSGSDIAQLSSGLFNSSVIPQINLAASGAGGVGGNLPVTNLNGGAGATSSTVWCGNGTWCTPSGSITGQTAGYALMAANANSSTSSFPIDFNITTGGTITAHDPFAIAGIGPGVIEYAAGNASTNPIPTCSSSMAQPWPTATVTDAITVTSGATYASGGAGFAFVVCNGSTGTWIVLGGGTGGGGGNPAFVSAVGAVGTNSVNPSTTATLSITTGNLLILYGIGFTITGWNTPSGCATWTAQGSPTTGSEGQSVWTGTANTTGSCTVTLSATSSSSAGLGGSLVQASNATTTGLVLSAYGTATCSPSCTGSTLTTTAANSLVLTFMAYGGAISMNTPSPFSFDVNGVDAAGILRGAGHYVQASTGLYTPTWTMSPGAAPVANVSVAVQ